MSENGLYEDISNIGNTNGEEILCKNCNEPWENTWVLEDLYGEITEEMLILGPHHDNPDGEHTRITGLKTCPCCKEKDSDVVVMAKAILHFT